MAKKPRVVWVGGKPFATITAKERKEIARRIKKERKHL
jgi:hypothetical protein